MRKTIWSRLALCTNQYLRGSEAEPEKKDAYEEAGEFRTRGWNHHPKSDSGSKRLHFPGLSTWPFGFKKKKKKENAIWTSMRSRFIFFPN